MRNAARHGLLLPPLLLPALLLPVACGSGSAEENAPLRAAETAPRETPAPPLMEGIGDASMPITTRSEAAQRYFDQGLNLLHCFWDFEAYRAFREVVRLDPEAGMGYWGLYMALAYNQAEHPGEREELLRRAEALLPKMSAREAGYVRALVRLVSPAPEDGQRGFLEEMQALLGADPGDLQARLFLVKFLMTDTGGTFTDPAAGAGAEPESAVERSLEILRPLLDSHPESAAVHHYWMHANEYGDPSLALESAEKLPDLAPGCGHIRHMPGHVYYLLGEHERAYAAFHDAREFDRAYLERTGVAAVDHWNYVHNLDYLVANCAEDGRYAEGRRWAEVVQETPAEAHRRHAVGLGYVLYAGHTALARLHLRYGNWGAAAAALEERLASGALPSELARLYLEGLLLHSRGMEAAYAGDSTAAGAFFQRLVDHVAGLHERRAELGADWYYESARRILDLSVHELNGTILSALGRHEEAIAQLRRAAELELRLGYWEPPHYARPVLQSLADAYLRARRIPEARATYERELARRPGSGHAYFGIARTHVFEGDNAAARRAMQKLLEVWRHADPDLPQIRDTRAWLAANP